MSCDAFWSSIHREIAANEFDHREPYDGDDGVRYEPRDDVPAAYVERLDALLVEVAPHR